MAITKEQIFSVADELVAAGKTATLASVRAAVGGGSFTTISEALKEWRATSVPAPAVLHEPAPAALSDRLAGVINETWAMALDMANGRLQSERDALGLVRVELEASRQEAADLADQLSADLEAAQGVIAEHVATAAAAALDADRQAGELARLAADLAQAGEEARTAQAALVESRGRVDQLADLLAREQVAGIKSVERASQAEKSAAVLAERLEGIERRGAAAVVAAAKVEAALQGRIDDLASDLADAKKREAVAAKPAKPVK